MMPPLLFLRENEVQKIENDEHHGVRHGAQPSVSAKEWWGRRRLRYNIGLLIAGPLAFAVQIAVVSWGVSSGAIPSKSHPAMGNTILIDGIGYLLTIGVANGCYFLGRLSEGIRVTPWTETNRIAALCRLMNFPSQATPSPSNWCSAGEAEAGSGGDQPAKE
jgi:hypothetical protein